MKPFFSIVVPCCDVEPYVRECLGSVLDQPFKALECLVVVETSNDATEAAVRGIAAKDERVKVFTQPRSGSPAAPRNTALDHAEGEYVVFLDGDDVIAEGSLQRLHDMISARPGADLYPCALVACDAALKPLPVQAPTPDVYPQDSPVELSGTEATILLGKGRNMANPMAQMTVCRRGFLEERNLRFVPGLRSEDAEFSPRALYCAKRVVPLHLPFYMYRTQRQGSIMTGGSRCSLIGDWAKILNSLMAFHVAASKDKDFDGRVASAWSRHWLNIVFYSWFFPNQIRKMPKDVRRATLSALFADGGGAFRALRKCAPLPKRVAGLWVEMFVRFPPLRPFIDLFFRLYFKLADRRSRRAESKGET